MERPLISIICTVYNQESFIEDCLNSVFSQDYQNFELIIHDNGSTDGSVRKINQQLRDKEKVKFKALNNNIGLPKAFNLGYRLSIGEFIIDLSGDDMLAKGALQSFISHFRNLDEEHGVVYSNSTLINASGREIGNHFRPGKKPPEGWIFSDLLERYFISAPTMMFRRRVLEQLNGYDEDLIYEDFDFWVRSSREFKYSYLDKITILERDHGGSFSASKLDPQFENSTFQVCKKAYEILRDENELAALRKRISYHLKQCIINDDQANLEAYLALFQRCDPGLTSRSWVYLLKAFPWITKRIYFILKSPFSIKPR